MPAYNEGRAIGEVIAGIEPFGYRLVVVDDCSADDTYEQACRHAWVHVLRHRVNLGQGASLQTGTEYALSHGARYLVHFDSDGQHPVEQVERLLRPLISGRIDVALGSRFKSRARGTESVPLGKRLLLRPATWYTRVATGLAITDTHNGFRALTARAASRMEITQNRMAHASEILSMIAREKLRYVEVPVTIRYTDYSMAKGQSMWNALNILWEDMFARFRR